jgi:hypothetical protein
MSAAGDHQHRGARSLLRRREKNRERRIVDILDPIVFGLFGFVAAILKTESPATKGLSIGVHSRMRTTRKKRVNVRGVDPTGGRAEESGFMIK